MSMNDRLFQLLDAVEAERADEERFFREQMEEKTLKEKVKAGIAWHPVSFVNSGYSIGDFLEIKIERSNTTEHAGKFREGNGVSLQLVRSGSTDFLKGTIMRLGKNHMQLLCRSDDVDDLDIPLSHINAVELVYDEKPFANMKDALTRVIQAEKGSLFHLKKAVYANEALTLSSPSELRHQHKLLNASQTSAISHALAADKIAIIHGPPGTGKTTTLVALIKELSAVEKRILVCASSNHATDLLALKCMEAGLDTVRLGNLSRIGDDVLKITLDEKVRANTAWDQIKKYRIEAEKIRKQAAKFKRSFGPEERALRKQLFSEARSTIQYADQLEEEMVNNVLQQAQVVVTTLMSSSSPILNRLTFETLVVDEASQTSEPECWIAMSRAQKVIFAGDPMQLPPTVKTARAVSLGLQTTLLDHLLERGIPGHLLNVQYRMSGDILSFPNQHFYKGQLNSPDHVNDQKLHPDQPALQFIDTAGTGYEEVREEESMSLYNPGEWSILQNHITQHLDQLKGKNVAVISPYAEQVRFIQGELKSMDDNYPFVLDVDTVDGFQGQERDVVYISLVRSNEMNEIGFLNDLRRLNVAITRARLQAVIIGDSVTLSKNTTYSQLIAYAEKIGGYRSAWDFMSW